MTSVLRDIEACVFDAYGTLLDLGSATARVAAELGDKAETLGAVWRTKQLEYTWLRSLMGRYADFWQVTGDALDYALETVGLSDPGLRARLMAQYRALDAYPDVAPALARLRAAGLRTAILSNGAPDMLAAGVASAGLDRHLDAVLSVDALGIYKPHPSAYQLACDHFGLDRRRIAFVSSNPWDVAGAASFGLRVVWLNRFGRAAERLPGTPEAVIEGLDALPSRLGL